MAVLIKGKSIACSQKSRDHYLRGQENEKITVLDVFGFATKNADDALQMIELSAKSTKCKKPLYSAKINPEPGRPFTKKEIKQAIELLEQNLGLTGHQRVVVEHIKKGRIHYHVLWNRFPPDGGPARNMGNDYTAHQKTQRQLEKELKLKPMRAKGRNFKDWEVKWAKRYGHDIFHLREEITGAFNSTKSGQDFMTQLKAKGIVLCRGDKSQFVIILPWGQHKALSSMIHGRPAKATLRRAMADIDIRQLLTVAEGKERVKAMLPNTVRNTGSKGRSSRRKRIKERAAGQTSMRHGSTSRRHGSASSRGGLSSSWQRSSYAKIGSALATSPRSSALWRASSLATLSWTHMVSRTGRFRTEAVGSIGTGEPRSGVSAHASSARAPTRQRKSGNARQSTGKSIPPEIKKSPILAAIHAGQWKDLNARYAAKRRAACDEPDEARRESALAEIERQEIAERSALAARQEDETNADLATRIRPVRKERGRKSMPTFPIEVGNY